MINTDARRVRALIEVVIVIETVQMNEIIRLTDGQIVTNGEFLMIVVTLRIAEIILRVELRADPRVLKDGSASPALLYVLVVTVKAISKEIAETAGIAAPRVIIERIVRVLRLQVAKTIIKNLVIFAET